MYSQVPFLEALCQEMSVATLDKSLISVLQCRILQRPLRVHRNPTGLTEGQSLASNKVLYLISNHLIWGYFHIKLSHTLGSGLWEILRRVC